ncbi:cellulose-binding protein [Microbulbifer halophilus]|uniref:Cellulose-binding protein n=1 Tax=Microbulbifer halophilus TaxID=453963 RepID=A0ABW5E7M4_9GAMM|nr:cellulose-binding protein [Microbulbifer halophilus]MCW8125285.1 cellulose-binding protein [Microbulbifer halophilus]
MEENYDGALISELGVKRYLKGRKDIQVSNINFFTRGAETEKAWKACNFGCHGPSYRNLIRPSSFGEFLQPIDETSPALAGIIDGVRHQTVGKAQRLGGGIKRTGEGLKLSGNEAFQNVGNENWAVYEFAQSSFDKLTSVELNSLDNPIFQIVTVIINEYTSVIPEWVLNDAHRDGAFILPDTIDTAWVLKAISLHLIEGVSREDLNEAVHLLNDPTQRLIGKQIGMRLASAIGAILASLVCKKLMAQSRGIDTVKRDLAKLRSQAKKANGSLGKTLLALLNAQGVLSRAGEASRRLQQTSPRIWHILRYRLNGANMVYFLVEPLLQEYIDRLSLLEKKPAEFAKVMTALVRDKQTRQIFFPGTAF